MGFNIALIYQICWSHRKIFQSTNLTGMRAATREKPSSKKTGGCIPSCAPVVESSPSSLESTGSAAGTLSSWRRDVRAKSVIFAAGRHIRTTSLHYRHCSCFYTSGRSVRWSIVDNFGCLDWMRAAAGRSASALRVALCRLSINRCWIIERHSITLT